MFRTVTLLATLILILLPASSKAQQSNPQNPTPTGQSTDRTRTDSKDKAQKDRTQSERSTDATQTQSDKTTDTATGKLSGRDREFAMKAAEGGKLEVKHAEMALKQSSNEDVKRYAQKMLDDHTKANQELIGIASGKGITLPGEMQGMKSETSPSSAPSPSSATGATSPNPETSGDMRKTDPGAKKADTSKDHATMERMSKMSGAEFDREYVKMDRKAHKKTIELFEKQARNGRDAALKSFAEKTLPALREHHQMARDLASKLGVADAASND